MREYIAENEISQKHRLYVQCIEIALVEAMNRLSITSMSAEILPRLENTELWTYIDKTSVIERAVVHIRERKEAGEDE